MSEIIYGCLPSVVKEPCPWSTLCRGALSLKCVKLGNNPKFYGMRTAQCKVGKQAMWGERGRAKLEPCSSACESPDTHSKAGSPGNISLSTVCPYYLRLDRVLLWSPCLTAHKRRGFWDLILSPASFGVILFCLRQGFLTLYLNSKQSSCFHSSQVLRLQVLHWRIWLSVSS